MYSEKSKLGYCGKNVVLKNVEGLNENVFIYDHVNIYENARLIIGPGGKFIMKHHSGASQGLTVITGKHGHQIGSFAKDLMISREKDIETTITVNEDVRIGANVTLLPGVTVGRGAQIGACSVITKDVPPYAVVAGNPAKVLKFIFNPDEIIEHEKRLYPSNERLPYMLLFELQRDYVRTKL